MKYYIDNNGNYLGGSDGAALSANEVPFAPDDAKNIWDGLKWNIPAAQIETKRISSINAEAGKRIKTLVPTSRTKDSKYKLLEREMNLVMLNAELDEKVLTGGTLTAAEQTKKNNFITLKDGIKEIRKTAKTAKNNGDSLATFIVALDAKGY